MASDSKISDWQAIGVKDIAQNEKSPLFIAAFAETRLSDVAEVSVQLAGEDIARLGFAVAHCIDNSAPAVNDLSAEQQALAVQIASALLAAKKALGGIRYRLRFCRHHASGRQRCQCTAQQRSLCRIGVVPARGE